jgi:hypothetical protein
MKEVKESFYKIQEEGLKKVRLHPFCEIISYSTHQEIRHTMSIHQDVVFSLLQEFVLLNLYK